MEAVLALVGLGLAAPGVIDCVVRAGREIETRISSTRHLPDHIRKYRTFGTELSRGVLFTQLELVASAINQRTIGGDLKDQLEACFQKIVECLIAAEKELKKVEANEFKGILKILFGMQLGLESKIRELEQQRDIFTSLANLIHQHQTAPPVSHLGNRVKLRHESARSRPGSILPISDIRVAKCEMGKSVLKSVVVESRPFNSHSKPQLEEDIQVLVQKLRQTSSSTSIMNCLGYRQNPFHDTFEILFELPTDPTQRSLADMLASDLKPTLNHRVALCKLLANAVSEVHSIDLVHKSIRPRNILVVGTYHVERSAQTLFLTDWTLVREVGEASVWQGEDEWQRAIYQHMTRQGLHAERKYTINHDIYSLGVCMLEVLLWRPFIVDPAFAMGSASPNPPRELSEFFQQRAVALGPSVGVPERYLKDTQNIMRSAVVVKAVLVDLCRTELPPDVGSKLTEVVMRCLKCLDEDDGLPVGESEQERLEDGLRFVRDVMVGLGSVSV